MESARIIFQLALKLLSTRIFGGAISTLFLQAQSDVEHLRLFLSLRQNTMIDNLFI
jgi:hypothetical protein